MALHRWLGAILVTSVLMAGCGKPPQSGGTTAATTTTTGAAPATTETAAPPTASAPETPVETPAADATASPESTGTPAAASAGAGAGDDYANAEGLAGYEEVAALTPPPSSPEAIARGKELYAGMANCTSCHGPEGRGDGPAGQALDPPPRNLHAKAEYKYGAGDHGVYRTVFYGVDGTGMAPLEGILTPEQAWDVVHYVHTLQDS